MMTHYIDTNSFNYTSQTSRSDTSVVDYTHHRDWEMDDTIELATLRARFDEIAAQNEAQGIVTSISLLDGESGESLYNHNATTVHFAASINKLPIALLVLEDLRTGTLSADATVQWKDSDARPGYGKFDQTGASRQATVRELLNDMLNYSGNTAVRALVNYSLHGAAAVNRRLEAKPELNVTRLQVLDGDRFYVGNSTSKEAAWIIAQLLSADSDDDLQAAVRQALATNIFGFYGVRSQLENNDFMELANKAGILDDIDGNNRHDVGIIYNRDSGDSFIYSFMTTTKSANTAGTAQAEHSLDLLGRYTLRYAGDEADDNLPLRILNPQAVDAQPESRVRY